jgi:hypothetical protein
MKGLCIECGALTEHTGLYGGRYQFICSTCTIQIRMPQVIIDTSRDDRYSDEDFELYKAQARAAKANTRMLLDALRGV